MNNKVLLSIVGIVVVCSLLFVVSGSDYSDAEDYEAKIGDTNYTKLADAISNVAQDQEIIVLKDIAITSSVYIEGNVSFTLNFDNHVLSATNLGNNNFIQIGGFGSGPTYEGDLIIKNCVFSSDGTGMTSVNHIQAEISGDLTIDKCTFNYFSGLNREIRVVGAAGTPSVNVIRCTFDIQMGEEQDVIKTSGTVKELIFTTNTIDGSEDETFCVKPFADAEAITIAVPEAKIDNVFYTSIDHAIAAVQDDQTVLVLKDITRTSSLNIVNNKSYTLDFDGNTFTATNLGNNNFIQIGGFGAGPTYEGDLIISNCKFVGGAGMTSVNHIQAEISGDLTIDGCTFNHFAGLNREIRVVGAAGTPSVNVIRCTFDKQMGTEEDIIKVSGTVTGINLDSNIIKESTDERFCDKPFADAEAITIAVPEAKIDNVFYTSIDHAIAAVQDDQTVLVLKDITRTSSLNIVNNKSYTLDFGGYKLTASDLGNYNMIQIGGFGAGPTYEGDLIISNCEFVGGTGLTSVNCIQAEISGDLTIDGCTFNYFAGLNREIRVVGAAEAAPIVTVIRCTFDKQMGTEEDIFKTSGTVGIVNFDSNEIKGATDERFCSKPFGTDDTIGYTIAVPEAKINNVFYATLKDAVAEATVNNSIILLKNASVDEEMTIILDVELIFDSFELTINAKLTNNGRISGGMLVLTAAADVVLADGSEMIVNDVNADNEAKVSAVGTFEITKSIVITANSAKKVYDGTELTAEYTVEPKLTFGTLEAQIVGGQTKAGKSANVVSSHTINFGGSVITAFYTNVTYVNGELEVTKAILTATYAGETVKCGVEPEFHVDLTGFIPGESETDITEKPVVDSPARVKGEYRLTPAGGSAENYEFEYVAGLLVIEHNIVSVAKEGKIIAHFKCDGCEAHFIDEAATMPYFPPSDESDKQEVVINSDVTTGVNENMSDSNMDKIIAAVTSIKDADENADVVANLSTSSKGTETLSMSSAKIGALADKGVSVGLLMDGASVVLPSSVLKEMSKEGNFQMKAKQIDVPEKYRKLVGDDGIVFDLGLDVNSAAVTTFSGLIKVSFHYVLPAGQDANNLKVWYLGEDGSEEFQCTYDELTQTASFETGHFSNYAVGFGSASNDNGSLLWVVLAVVGLAAVCILAGFVVKRY